MGSPSDDHQRRVAACEARRPYRTANGYIGVMIYNDKHWRAFFHALGDPEWSKDPMLAQLDVAANVADTSFIFRRVHPRFDHDSDTVAIGIVGRDGGTDFRMFRQQLQGSPP